MLKARGQAQPKTARPNLSEAPNQEEARGRPLAWFRSIAGGSSSQAWRRAPGFKHASLKSLAPASIPCCRHQDGIFSA